MQQVGYKSLAAEFGTTCFKKLYVDGISIYFYVFNRYFKNYQKAKKALGVQESEQDSTKRHSKNIKKLGIKIFGLTLYNSLGTIYLAGYHLPIEAVAIRLTMLVILVSSLFLYTSYTATIVALLQSPASFINTVEDFYKSHLTMGIEDLVYEKQLFQVSTYIFPIRQLFFFNFLKLLFLGPTQGPNNVSIVFCYDLLYCC